MGDENQPEVVWFRGKWERKKKKKKGAAVAKGR